MGDVADVVAGAHTYLQSTTYGPDLTDSFTSIERYLPSRALSEWTVSMPFLVVHPLNVIDMQATLGGRTGGLRDVQVQLAFDVFVAVTERRPDQGQQRAVELADLVLDKLRADHRWGLNVCYGGMRVEGDWVKDPVEVAAESLPVLIWRWETPGVEVD